MIKIYGLPLSNYYNKIILALKHKGLDYEEVPTSPSQDPEVVDHSPMGKIPFIEINGQFLSESNAIVEFLEAAFSDRQPLFPEDAFAAAKCREVINYIDMYLDGQSRRVLYSAYFGAPKDDALIDEVAVNLKRAVTALQKLITFKPYINSDIVTAADFSAITTMTLTSGVMTQLGRDDPLENFEGLSDYYQLMRTLPNVQSVEAARMKSYENFLKQNS